jgi:putative DNA methylase
MMSNGDDRRLIEDYLPIDALGRENTTAKGHLNTLHLWWARRPLVACRAAVYASLVPANLWVKDIELKNPPADPIKVEAVKNGAKKGLNRAAAGRFVTELCRFPASPRVIAQAQDHILAAHADRLSDELAQARDSALWPEWIEEFGWPRDQKRVTPEDIRSGRAPRPRVLDMFAGGGAIPFEALRLGCDAIANDLNPVAHVIELATLDYAQRFGTPDTTPRAIAPDDAEPAGTWRGLAEEVRYWGEWIIRQLKREIGDLYPLVPDPTGRRSDSAQTENGLWTSTDTSDVPKGFLVPVAFAWTRTVPCKKRTCGAAVPLVRQTWMCKKKGRFIALKMIAPKGQSKVGFEVVEATSEAELGFDPASFSTAGNATCPFCSTVADNAYVKRVGVERGYGFQEMAAMCIKPGARGKVYAPYIPSETLDEQVEQRIQGICTRSGLTLPAERLDANPRSFDVQRYGHARWRDVFTRRQQLLHLAVAEQVRSAARIIAAQVADADRAEALATCLSLAFSRLVTQNNAFCGIHSGRETIEGPLGDGKFPMSWDFVETNPFSGVTGSARSALDWTAKSLEANSSVGARAQVMRGSATSLTLPDECCDAVITDPPYYDNYSYSNLADAFYVWMKRSLGGYHSEHFASELTPKKPEIIKARYRHGNDDNVASRAYEDAMTASLMEAHRVLKPNGVIAIVYAHKTTLGWSTLVDSLRQSGFMIVEAWPLATEAKGGRKKVDKAMLASSIFLVARKLTVTSASGNYEDDVRPDLERIVRERVATLWDQGISGADLVIAAVGAGLRAFTRYSRVEYANGEEVPATRFLAEVEGVVLDVMLDQIAGKVARGVTAVDPDSRFYVLWRYVYKGGAVEAGEAIVFTYAQHVELDGANGLASGRNPLVEKVKGKYRLRDFSERGKDDKLGMPRDDGEPAPLIDALHRVLWLMEHRPRRISDFLRESRCNVDQLRVLAQALSGPALKGGEVEQVSAGEELSALLKLTANWRSVVEDALSPLERSH